MSVPYVPTSEDFRVYIDNARWRLFHVKKCLTMRAFLHERLLLSDPYTVSLTRLEYTKHRTLLRKLARVRSYFKRTLREHGTNCPPPLFDARDTSR